MLGWNEFHIEGCGLFLEVLQAAGVSGGGDVEGFIFVVVGSRGGLIICIYLLDEAARVAMAAGGR